ncbi:hypothetical protein [Enterococcus pallens]|uniref:Uncharacterized protein n=1 Tax=Enterococcus pallens ATCC BAA-351 TaxID=1158607 RepID=R2SUE7_9ENTE|nr:hypothetical protein [Enterococcus pallens]EOH96421.1 hypothetical protein UAU_01072 [Enterococcus pallens ATCC BAA-351]EOU14366.1 hypothetical protein I588_04722 [Enterococcus pallens ATCC BAA-351]
MENIEIGGTYLCKAIGLEKEVVGVVEQLYTNTALINVLTYDPIDRTKVIELQNRLLVKYEDISNQMELEYPA